MTQIIRPSQFIITYGPGAILEGADGPVLIPDMNKGLFNQQYNDFKPKYYRIDDNRLSKGLLEGANICRLPTNEEHEYDEDKVIYHTKPFPQWKLCIRQERHNGESSILYNTDSCPICQYRSRTHAVRFVMSCKDGHLDDVPWKYLIHNGASCNENKIGSVHSELRHHNSFLWNNIRGDVYIKCPRCDTSVSLNKLYYRNSVCSGRYPQSEEINARPSKTNCEKEARIIARQAANIRVPEIRTLLSIQSVYTNLDRIIQQEALQIAISISPINSTSQLEQILDKLLASGAITVETANVLREADWSEVQRAIIDSKIEVPTTYSGLISDEFNGLYKASKEGAPPQNSRRTGQEILFEVDPNYIRHVTTNNNTRFTITPIQTLRTVTVQVGFTRDIPEQRDMADSDERTPPRIISTGFHDDDSSKQWFPGVEFFGEGLFIRLDSNSMPQSIMQDNASKKWYDGLENANSYPGTVFRDKEFRNEICPNFVWWHTLSHLLIRAIGEEAGYSSASIRERIYSEGTDVLNGGILLYATQPGSEGTLGGLVALAPYMQRIFDDVLENVKTCSGDPLCSDIEFHTGKYNGAACYACLMNSETSCEHRNMWLDRHVLLNNLP